MKDKKKRELKKTHHHGLPRRGHRGRCAACFTWYLLQSGETECPLCGCRFMIVQRETNDEQ